MVNFSLSNPKLEVAFDTYKDTLNRAASRQLSESQADSVSGLQEMRSGLKKLIHRNFDVPQGLYKSTNKFLASLKSLCKEDQSLCKLFQIFQRLTRRFSTTSN